MYFDCVSFYYQQNTSMSAVFLFPMRLGSGLFSFYDCLMLIFVIFVIYQWEFGGAHMGMSLTATQLGGDGGVCFLVLWFRGAKIIHLHPILSGTCNARLLSQKAPRNGIRNSATGFVVECLDATRRHSLRIWTSYRSLCIFSFFHPHYLRI